MNTRIYSDIRYIYIYFQLLKLLFLQDQQYFSSFLYCKGIYSAFVRKGRKGWNFLLMYINRMMNPVLPWDEQCTWDTWFRRYRSKESLRCLLSLSLSGEEPWGALGERCTWNTSACNRVTLERHSYFSTFLSPRISISTHPPPRHPPRRVCLITTDVKLALTFRSLEILTHVLVNYSSLLSIVFPFLLFSFVNGSVAICWKRNLRICLKRSLFDRSATRFISNKLVPCLYVEGNKRCVPWEIIIELRFYNRTTVSVSWKFENFFLLENKYMAYENTLAAGNGRWRASETTNYCRVGPRGNGEIG